MKKIYLALLWVVGVCGQSYSSEAFNWNFSHTYNGHTFSLPSSGDSDYLWYNNGMEESDTDYFTVYSSRQPDGAIVSGDIDSYVLMSRDIHGNYFLGVSISPNGPVASGTRPILYFSYQGTSVNDLTISGATYYGFGGVTVDITSGLPQSMSLSAIFGDQATADAVQQRFSDPLWEGDLDFVGASGGAFVEQAQELNVGLTFTNGQWAPTP